LYEETFGTPEFPDYPFENMPWSLTPVVSWFLAIADSGVLSSRKCNLSTFPFHQEKELS